MRLSTAARHAEAHGCAGQVCHRLRYEAFVARMRADARFERHYQEGRRLAIEDAATIGLNGED
jgi:hypothetical protein